jgi:hypothetical protein
VYTRITLLPLLFNLFTVDAISAFLALVLYPVLSQIWGIWKALQGFCGIQPAVAEAVQRYRTDRNKTEPQKSHGNDVWGSGKLDSDLLEIC